MDESTSKLKLDTSDEYHSISSLAAQVAAVARAKQRAREKAQDEIPFFNLVGFQTRAKWIREKGVLVFSFPSGGTLFQWKCCFEDPFQEGKLGADQTLHVECVSFDADGRLRVRQLHA